jgi:hypothetical protein
VETRGSRKELRNSASKRKKLKRISEEKERNCWSSWQYKTQAEKSFFNTEANNILETGDVKQIRRNKKQACLLHNVQEKQ